MFALTIPWPTWQWRLLPFRGASAKPQFMYAVALTLVHLETRDVCAWVSKEDPAGCAIVAMRKNLCMR